MWKSRNFKTFKGLFHVEIEDPFYVLRSSIFTFPLKMSQRSLRPRICRRTAWKLVFSVMNDLFSPKMARKFCSFLHKNEENWKDGWRSRSDSCIKSDASSRAWGSHVSATCLSRIRKGLGALHSRESLSILDWQNSVVALSLLEKFILLSSLF